MKKSVDVRRALGCALVPVHAVLCVVDGDWPLFPKPIEIHGVTVLWPKELERRVAQLGKLEPAVIPRSRVSSNADIGAVRLTPAV